MAVTTRMMGRNTICRCGRCTCCGIVPIKIQRKREKRDSLKFENIANGK